jgi:CBS domain-containing protein
MPTSSTLSTKLSSTPIQVLLSDKKSLVDLPADSLLGDCLSLMAEHQISSIPVYTLEDGSKSYKGIVSISDILAKTVFLYLIVL